MTGDSEGSAQPAAAGEMAAERTHIGILKSLVELRVPGADELPAWFTQESERGNLQIVGFGPRLVLVTMSTAFAREDLVVEVVVGACYSVELTPILPNSRAVKATSTTSSIRQTGMA